MTVPGDLGGAVARFLGAAHAGEEPVGQPVAQAGDAPDGIDPPGDGRPHGGGHADDAGHVVRAAAPVALLAAAVDDRLDIDAVAHHQGAHALGPAELVGADRDQVGDRGQVGHVEPRERLHGVGMEDGVGRRRLRRVRHLGERLNRADLVVGQHHRHDPH